MAIELTTVADDEVVLHDGAEVHRHTGLQPTGHVGLPRDLDGDRVGAGRRCFSYRCTLLCRTDHNFPQYGRRLSFFKEVFWKSDRFPICMVANECSSNGFYCFAVIYYWRLHDTGL